MGCQEHDFCQYFELYILELIITHLCNKTVEGCVCSDCGKIYKYSHKCSVALTSTPDTITANTITANTITANSSTIEQLLKQNQDLIELVKRQQATIEALLFPSHLLQSPPLKMIS